MKKDDAVHGVRHYINGRWVNGVTMGRRENPSDTRETVAEYAGIHGRRQIMLAMAISGGLAGMVGMNEIAGVSGRLLLDFVAGAGFTGIAVSLMGRNHPVGIVFSSLLFGILFQGGAEVAFEVPGFTRDMVVTLQGFIVLFSGAMAYVAAPWLGRLLALRSGNGKEVRRG